VGVDSGPTAVLDLLSARAVATVNERAPGLIRRI
jgi:hypothetical protein